MQGRLRPGMMTAGIILSLLLLCAEYLLLVDDARSRQQRQLSNWSSLWLENVESRLQAGLDNAALVAANFAASNPRAPLAEHSDILLRQDGLFLSAAVLHRVPDSERQAYEQRQSQRIVVLQNGRRLPSPPHPVYFPVEAYIPDTSDGLAIGLDLGSRNGWLHAIESSGNRQRPVFAAYQAPGAKLNTLNILATIPGRPQLLLLTLDSQRLLAAGQGEASALREQLRLLAWARQNGRDPVLLLDSRPNLPLPAAAPSGSMTRKFGNMGIQFVVYPLAAPATLETQDALSSLVLPTGLGVLLLFFLYRLAQSNTLFRTQLTRQNALLEGNNRVLRSQVEERSRSEQALAKSEARQRAILQASSEAILLINRSGHVSDVNPAAAKLIRQSVASLTDLPIGTLLVELYDHTHSQSFEDMASSYGGLPFEANLVLGDSSQLPVELSLSRVVLPDDVFYVALCRDISARKAHEAALIRLKNSLAEQVDIQRRQLAALLDASPLAMAYIADRRLKQVNHAFLDLFETQEDACLNRTTRRYFESQEQWDRTGRILYNLLNEGKVVKTELRLHSGTGRRFWCRLYGKALNPSLPGLGTIWLYQDFSTERAAQDALRTAKELAEETSRAKTEFLANMSHELRTPMHAILGFAEMGYTRSGQVTPEKVRHYFARIQSSGGRLLSLLNDLLDLAKMEVGRMDYHFEDVDLALSLDEACEELNPLAEARGLTVTHHCEPAPMRASADPVRIGQVLRNLLSNAIKFSPPGSEVEIRMWLEQRRAPSCDQIRFSIRDWGPGIPPSELETIFDKFIQSSSTKTGAGGTGLGLAICREIVRAHAGEIRAENAAEGGAIFSFTIPLMSARDGTLGAENGIQASLGR
ncbi:ATP-binding protein [Paludibacterium yongneupense]|uniref:ATP-binding protein n=1 Tax=Paludibacterium yongneupense TaxID=400061 RepID=UPI000409EB1F|nr:ATP-binding protein [Paludibacterium yongneupense]